MKANSVLLVCATCFVLVHAEAFKYSAGWSPGQTVATTTAPTPTVTFRTTPAAGAQFSWSSLLTSGPIGSLLSRSGINLTERLEEAKKRAGLPWDDRIPMIRDDNYKELIFDEAFASPEEEESRVWFLFVTVTSSQQTGLSSFLDQQFNEAFNESSIQQDLPNVRWGRIDYLNVTRLTTKWVVWRPPVFIIAKDRGKTLRFFQAQQLGGRASALRRFLKEETWMHVPPWTGVWAPGGSREELLDKFAVFQEILYFYSSKIPRWMYLLITGGMGSILLGFLHRKPQQKVPPSKSPANGSGAKPGVAQTVGQSSAVYAKPSGQKRRENK